MACSNGLIWLIHAWSGGMRAMKMETSAAYIGTVMNALTLPRVRLRMFLTRCMYDLSWDVGGVCLRRSEIGVERP
jgi:hypothetical protein